jgi:hypothetical protein
MKEIIKEMIQEIMLPFRGLTRKQKAIVVYFVFSFCSLCVSNETPILIAILIVLNFANAARLVKKVPIHEIDE